MKTPRALLFVFAAFFALLFVAPLITSAAEFAKPALFLRDKEPVVNTKTTVYAVFTNQSDQAFDGTVELRDKKVLVGKHTLTIPGFSAVTQGISWTPSTTEHTLTASLVDNNKVLLEEASVTFDIAEKKSVSTQDTPSGGSTHSPQASSTVQNSDIFNNAVTRISPTAGHAITPALHATDAARGWLTNYLEMARKWSQDEIAKVAKKPTTTSSTEMSASTIMSQGKTIAWQALIQATFYASSALIYVVTHIALFYPVFAFLFFMILWRTYWYFATPTFNY